MRIKMMRMRKKRVRIKRVRMMMMRMRIRMKMRMMARLTLALCEGGTPARRPAGKRLQMLRGSKPALIIDHADPR